MRRIGYITNECVLAHWGPIKCRVILTDERIGHICEGHMADYLAYADLIPAAIEMPDYVLDDAKNAHTAMFIKQVPDTNINVVVRLACENEASDLDSSVITMYRLGEKTLKRLVKRNTVVYKREEL